MQLRLPGSDKYKRPRLCKAAENLVVASVVLWERPEGRSVKPSSLSPSGGKGGIGMGEIGKGKETRHLEGLMAIPEAKRKMSRRWSPCLVPPRMGKEKGWTSPLKMMELEARWVR